MRTFLTVLLRAFAAPLIGSEIQPEPRLVPFPAAAAARDARSRADGYVLRPGPKIFTAAQLRALNRNYEFREAARREIDALRRRYGGRA